MPYMNWTMKRKCGDKYCLYTYKTEFFRREFLPIDAYYCQKNLQGYYSQTFVVTIVERKCLKFDCKYNILFVVDQLHNFMPLIYLPHVMFFKTFYNCYWEKYFFVPFLTSTRDSICQLSSINDSQGYVCDVYMQDIHNKSVFMLSKDQFIFEKYDLENWNRQPSRFKNISYSHLKQAYPFFTDDFSSRYKSYTTL